MTDLSKIGSLAGMTFEDTDTLPSEYKGVLDSDIYSATIDLAYLEKAASGSLQMHVVFKTDTSTVRDRFTLTSGDAKQNRNYYIDQKGVQRPLPDLLRAHHLARVAVDKGLDQLTTQEKTIKLYDFSAQEERPVKKEVFVDLIGKDVQLGLLKVVQNKRVQQGSVWVDTDETKEVNEVNKFFNSDGQTATEQAANEPGSFREKWLTKNQGTVVNRAKKGSTASSAPAVSTPSTTKSLFSD